MRLKKIQERFFKKLQKRKMEYLGNGKWEMKK